MATFFENLGWKVYRVPETATVLMSGGISFGELNDEQVFDFQVRKKSNKTLKNFNTSMPLCRLAAMFDQRKLSH